jgi:hypothetical protein
VKGAGLKPKKNNELGQTGGRRCASAAAKMTVRGRGGGQIVTTGQVPGERAGAAGEAATGGTGCVFRRGVESNRRTPFVVRTSPFFFDLTSRFSGFCLTPRSLGNTRQGGNRVRSSEEAPQPHLSPDPEPGGLAFPDGPHSTRGRQARRGRGPQPSAGSGVKERRTKRVVFLSHSFSHSEASVCHSSASAAVGGGSR